MANNSERRAVHFMVYGATPPNDTNVLWMDTSKADSPVLKIFLGGAWTYVRDIPEQKYYDELANKVNTAVFNDTVQEIEENVASNSEAITTLNETVQDMRVINQKIVESIESIPESEKNVHTIYLVLNGSNSYDAYIYVEETDSFSSLGESKLPIINIEDIDTDLDMCIVPGVYNVVICGQQVSPTASQDTPYLLYVIRKNRRGNYSYYQTLIGRAINTATEKIVVNTRSKSGNNDWSEWTDWKGVVYDSELAQESEIRNSAISTAKQEVLEEIEKEFLPLIYAGL